MLALGPHPPSPAAWAPPSPAMRERCFAFASTCSPLPHCGRVPSASEAGEGGWRQSKAGPSAAVKDVVAEFLHFEDRGVRAPGDRLCHMRLDDLADDDVVVALLDDAGDSALDRRRCGIEDRRAGGALMDRLAGELAVFEFGRLEEGERDALAVL